MGEVDGGVETADSHMSIDQTSSTLTDPLSSPLRMEIISDQYRRHREARVITRLNSAVVVRPARIQLRKYPLLLQLVSILILYNF